MSKKAKKAVARKLPAKKSTNFHGIENDLLIIAGGGFVLIIIILMLLGN